jgi:hypothetical protein
MDTVTANLSNIKRALLTFTEFIDEFGEYISYFPKKEVWYYELAENIFLAYYDVGKDLLPFSRVDVSEIEKSVKNVQRDLKKYIFHFGYHFDNSKYTLNLKIRSGIQYFMEYHSFKICVPLQDSVALVDREFITWLNALYVYPNTKNQSLDENKEITKLVQL